MKTTYRLQKHTEEHSEFPHFDFPLPHSFIFLLYRLYNLLYQCEESVKNQTSSRHQLQFVCKTEWFNYSNLNRISVIYTQHTNTLTYCIRFPQRARAACAQWKLFTLMSIYNNWPIALISRYDQTKSCPGQARKNTTARGVRLCECVCVRVSVCMWFDHESPDKSSIKSAWLFISKCLGFTLIKSDGQLIYIGSINGIIIYIQEIEIKYTFCLERHERSEW